MEWEAPALVLSAMPYGESSVIAHVLTGKHGLYHGMVRGGASRQGRPVWQAGNLITARWSARVPDQLGGLRGELVHASAARVLDFGLPLAMLASMCALADTSLPEREPHLAVFQELTRLLACISLDPVDAGQTGMAALIRWEALLLSDLGFGLDLSCCAVSGQKHDLKWVSPRSGRAVSDEHAGQWRDRLLALPPFLLDPAQDGTPADWLAGLRLTGHFLARDAFGQRHRPLPAARIRLLDMVARMAENGDLSIDPEGAA